MFIKIKKGCCISSAAVIGDRIYDIEAAKKSNSISIGVLFGYGGKEPEQADITITDFPSLLNIFPLPRYPKVSSYFG